MSLDFQFIDSDFCFCCVSVSSYIAIFVQFASTQTFVQFCSGRPYIGSRPFPGFSLMDANHKKRDAEWIKSWWERQFDTSAFKFRRLSTFDPHRNDTTHAPEQQQHQHQHSTTSAADANMQD